MIINEQMLKKYFSDKDNLFMLWTENDQLSMDEDFFPLEYLSLFIPLTGTVDFKTRFHTLHTDPSRIQFFSNDEAVRITEVSEDYSNVGLIFSRKYWNHTLLHAHPFLTMSVIHPCLEVTPQQRDVILEFYRTIRDLKASGTRDDSPVIINLILGMLFYIGRYYEKWSHSFPKKSNNKVVAKFVDLLFHNFRQHREVEFYAQELHLSKSRFTEIIRNYTGMSPFQCIEKYTLLKICSVLKNSDMTVKEISYTFNFSDTSHFCKFFKNHIGQSPLEFRKTQNRTCQDV